MGFASPPRFSIVVLARNEAQVLGHLLHDLTEFAQRGGELLVADTGSTDDTVAIARSFGCRIETLGTAFDSTLSDADAARIERRFALAGEGPLVTAGQRLFHFANARQEAGSRATHRYVLQLDAGDRVPALDIDALSGWLEGDALDAFEYEQQYGSVGLRISRFYDRTRFCWDGRVHEILQPVGIGESPSRRVRCETNQLSVRHHKDEAKPRNYLAGLALQVLESPQKPRWWHYLGRELFYGHAYESAIPVLEAHAGMASAWPAERSQSLCFVGQCCEALGSEEQAKEAYRRAQALDPSRREPLLRLGSLCCRQAEFEMAAECATQSLTIPRTSAYPEVEANYTWIPHSILYWSLFWLGRPTDARFHWDTYRSLAPEDSLVREHARLFPPRN